MTLLTRTDLAIRPDPRRVLGRLFVPGHELSTNTESRATGVLGRLLALSDASVNSTLARVHSRYDGRHRDLPGLLDQHFAQIAHRVPDVERLSPQRRALVGAVFTHEFAIEGAAVCNPSAVLHPDQSGLPSGATRFLLALRAIGEGHLSTVEFRCGVAGPGTALRLEEIEPFLEVGHVSPAALDRGLLAALLAEQGADAESTRYLVGRLPEIVTSTDLDLAVVALSGQQVTRHGGARTAELARRIAECGYEVTFRSGSQLAERVLWPVAATESRGMEDVRLVRFEAPGGAVSYRGTYTAYDGVRVAPALLETSDFQHFRMSPLAGPAAKDKGLALFPRTIAGRYLALSRSDRESTGLTTSVDGHRWGPPTPLQGPTQPWDLIQTGNCGSPIETASGWLVLTHGVGPMREYAVGALLLDLADPRIIRGSLSEPLLVPSDEERDGYVPNVVYSCGAVRLGDQLLLAYGASDASVRFAFVDLEALLARLEASTTRRNSAA